MSELAVGNGNELPDSWTTATLEEVATLNPRFNSTGVDATDLVHFVPMAAVAEDFGGIDVSQLRPYGDVRKGYTPFSEGDVLFAKITPCMENGKGALVPHLPHKHAFGSTEFHVLRSEAAMQPKWLAHYLSQPDFRRVARQNMAGTAGQLRVPTRWLAAAGIPVAPLAEQTRIVEKLEELLSDLDAGVAELKAAQRKLAQYRQSLLKAAVEGALTADWRAVRHSYDCPPLPSSPRKRGSIGFTHQGVMDSRFRGNDGQGETGAALLQRILTERRNRWETKQLAKFAEQGKTPPKGWQARYPEPLVPDTTDLPELPKGWVWASLDALVAESSYGTSVKCSYESRETPVLRIPNVSAGKLDLRDMKCSIQSLSLDEDVYLSVGDVLVIRTNGSIGLVGRAAAVIETLPAPHYFASYLLRLRCMDRVCLHRWISSVLAAHTGRRWLEARAASSAGQHNISLSTLLTMPVPLPPMTEQAHVLDLLASSMEQCDEQEEAVTRSLNQSAAQRKNILKAAFAGQLVPQDPTDEPASVLLERIRAERVTGSATATGKRGRKLKESA